jgi:hypothetical protein
MPSTRFPYQPVAIALLATLLLGISPALATEAPGGFVVPNTIKEAVAPPPTATQIRAFLPERGAFTFPSPWNSLGVRITNTSDCGGDHDCVNNGYNYYEKANNSAGLGTMLIIAGLHKHGGPTLFQFNKRTHNLAKLGPIFSDAHWQADSTEQMSFSLTKPYTLYVPHGSKMYAIDLEHMVKHGGTVRAKDKHLVYDLETLFPDKSHLQIWSPTVSANDRYFAAIVNLRDQNYFRSACMVYDSKKGKVIADFKATSHRNAGIHSCIMDKSGSYVWMSEEPMSCPKGHDGTVLGTVATGKTFDMCYTGGHRAAGYKHLLVNDKWGENGSKRMWNLDRMDAFYWVNKAPPPGTVLSDGERQGAVVWFASNWQTHPAGVTRHESWMHARPESVVPLDKQFVCGASGTLKIDSWHGDGIDWGTDFPYNGSVVCFKATTKHPNGLDIVPTLVVAPAMSFNWTMSNNYDVQPKGVMDPTGHWYIFTSNHGTNRKDLFMVKIPCQKLDACRPASISILSPKPESKVKGSVPVKAVASGTAGIARVQFQLDGDDIGPSLSHPPYTFAWNTSEDAPGEHSLTVLAFQDTRGYVSSKPVHVSLVASAGTSPPPDGIGAKPHEGGGAFAPWVLYGLLSLVFIGRTVRNPSNESS